MADGARFAALVISAKDRSTDRFVGAAAETIGPAASDQLFFSTVEIINRWQVGIELGHGIKQTFVRSFNQSRAKSPLTKFEDGLKNVNQFLELNSERLSEPVHCVLALVSGQQLYFSTVGQGTLLLRRAGKMSQIAGQEAAGLRFATVTSGDLQPKDWLIAPSQTLRQLIDQADLAAWSATPAAAHVRALLSPLERREQLDTAGVIVFRDPAATEPILIDPSEPERRLPIPLPSVAAVSGILHSWLSALPNLFRKKPAKTGIAPDAEPTDHEPTNASDATTNQRRPFPYRALIWPTIFAILLAIGITLIVGQLRRLNTKPPTVSTPTIASLIVKTPANQLFSFTDQNLTADNYNHLSAKQKATVADTLQKNNLTLIAPSAQVTAVPDSIMAMASSGNTLFLVDNTGQLWKYQTSLTKVVQQSLVAGPVSLAALSGSKALVSDQTGNIWLFDGSASQPINLALPTSLAQGPKLVANYGSSNVYMYQASANTIYKAGGFQTAIGNPTSVVSSDLLAFGTLTAWTIPGEFVAATAGGQIKEFNRSKLDSSLNIQYYTDNNPMALAISADGKQLIAARGKYVTTYNIANGAKLAEKVLVTTDPITAVAAGPSGKIWVAAGGALYQL